MKNTLWSGFAFAFALASLPGIAAADAWTIDPVHSRVEFAVRHMMVSTVRGTFNDFKGNVELDEQDPTKSSVNVVIVANSIDTREAKRDAHLKSADFFDTAKYPELVFKSTKFERAGKGKWKLRGDLTMHGVTKPIVLDVIGPTAAIKNPFGVLVRGVSASGKLARKDWGLTWNKALEAGGLAVGDEVELRLELELNPTSTLTAQK